MPTVAESREGGDFDTQQAAVGSSLDGSHGIADCPIGSVICLLCHAANPSDGYTFGVTPIDEPAPVHMVPR